MTKYQRMHFIFIKQYMKQIMEYKIDFFVGVLGVLLTQGLNLLFLNVLFQHIPSLEGWTFQQIAFIYGFSLLPKGIDHLFFDNLWALGQRLIRKGEFDKYLTRPISPLFHVLVETFQVDALGELLVGFILLSTTVSSISWTVPKVLLFIFIIPFATLIYTSLKIATSSIAFWTKQSGAVIYIFICLMTLLSILSQYIIIYCVGSLVLSFHLLLQLIIPLLTSYKIEMSILILVGLS